MQSTYKYLDTRAKRADGIALGDYLRRLSCQAVSHRAVSCHAQPQSKQTLIWRSTVIVIASLAICVHAPESRLELPVVPDRQTGLWSTVRSGLSTCARFKFLHLGGGIFSPLGGAVVNSVWHFKPKRVLSLIPDGGFFVLKFGCNLKTER
ncbi:hypothetical protein PoB_001566300 [Plakobranchus ocellatus]|uniref:Uncharacterized protein n=1 Tax=Plakobranchus ocellatus TaxID=259542 RepID=A0AAV3Z3I2_9GAST|nr:hypothetical protein PoB_001566300 [Plakobranchus ocellatus]